MAKYFTPGEFSCRCGCGLSKLDPDLIQILDKGRELFGRPIIITSGTRCERHNRIIGGALHSAHLVGADGWSHAVDIKVVSGQTCWELFHIFCALGIVRFEVSNKHLHIDNSKSIYHPQKILIGTYLKEV